MTKSIKKSTIQKILLFALLLIVLGMLFFFFREIIIPFISYEINGKYDEAKELLNSAGFIGMLAVSLIEGLQMVVVFIPAEFIQMSSGMAYPIWLTIILLDLGVIIGATIIWILVHTFKFNKDLFPNATRKIEQFAKKAKNTQLLMFLLFFTPVIPFGAICYYGSGSKIKYPRYIITCALGVIPSIVTSILMGKTLTKFLAEELNLVWLILIIVALAAVLLIFILVLLNHFIFKQDKGTPDHPMYSIMNKILKVIRHNGKNYKIIGQEKLVDLKDNFIVASNHAGKYDFYRAYKAVETNLANIANRQLLSGKRLTKITNAAGFIPKKLFDPDLETAIKTKKMLKKGYSVYVCPEGRLSIDGTNYEIDDTFIKFVKVMNVDLVLIRITGAYLAEGKFRNKCLRTPILVEIADVIKKEDIKNKDINLLTERVNKALSYNDFEYSKDLMVYKRKDKAYGLDGLLYRCPKCGKLYTMKSEGNTLLCDNCGFKLNILNNYHFDNSEFENIHTYYKWMKEQEKPNIHRIKLISNVKLKIFNEDFKGFEIDYGTCILTDQGISYKSNKTDYQLFKSIDDLPALAFSINEEFEFYYQNRLHYFYPIENKKECTRWALIVDLLNEEKKNGTKQ